MRELAAFYVNGKLDLSITRGRSRQIIDEAMKLHPHKAEAIKHIGLDRWAAIETANYKAFAEGEKIRRVEMWIAVRKASALRRAGVVGLDHILSWKRRGGNYVMSCEPYMSPEKFMENEPILTKWGWKILECGKRPSIFHAERCTFIVLELMKSEAHDRRTGYLEKKLDARSARNAVRK